MSSKILKVDRIATLNEMVSLAAIGATHFTIDLTDDPSFADNRKVSGNSALQLLEQSPKHVQVGIQISQELDVESYEPILAHEKARFVQWYQMPPPSSAISGFLARLRKPIAYSQLAAEHDDSPNTIENLFTAFGRPQGYLFQVELLAEMEERAWHFLTTECLKWENTLTAQKIDSLAKNWPIVIATGFELTQIDQLVAQLPHIQGFAFSLGEESTSPIAMNLHRFTLDQASTLLRGLSESLKRRSSN